MFVAKKTYPMMSINDFIILSSTATTTTQQQKEPLMGFFSIVLSSMC
jgi:hypothetical protein